MLVIDCIVVVAMLVLVGHLVFAPILSVSCCRSSLASANATVSLVLRISMVASLIIALSAETVGYALNAIDIRASSL